VETYEFPATIQRLSHIAEMVAKTDIEGVIAHLGVAESVAPLFDPDAYQHGSDRLKAIRGFLDDALKFKRSCEQYGLKIGEAGQMARDRRLALADPTRESATGDGGGTIPLR
jgi:hypothetical protein